MLFSMMFKGVGYMKPSKSIFKETMAMLTKDGYRVVYVPHKVIEDYNAAYNVVCQGKLITTGAAGELGILLGEIWVSELWKPYEKFIVFHELREIHYRSEGSGRDEVHEKASQDGILLWKDDSLFQKMLKDIVKMDKKTAQSRSKQGLG
jgi:competence protein ComEA